MRPGSARREQPDIAYGVRRFLLIYLVALLVAVTVLGIAAGKIPWGIDFSTPEFGEADKFGVAVRTVVFWSLVGNALLVTCLLGFGSYFFRCDRTRRGGRVGREEAKGRLRHLWLISPFGATVLLCLLAGPRLEQSLWNDELWSLEESVHGKWARDPGQGLSESRRVIYFDQLGWEHVVWRFETTNHHPLLNVLARAGLVGWRSVTGSEVWEFDEVALRALPFACALASLFFWGSWFRRAGFGAAGLVVPWLLALHPWFQQHATGMRGYPLVFCFLPLTLIALQAVMRHNSWRGWFGWSVGQCLLLASWPGAIAVVLGLNLVLCWALWWSRAEGLFGWRRWILFSLLSLTVTIPLYAPAVFQIGPYLRDELPHFEMGLPWLRNLANFFFVGSGWPGVAEYAARSGAAGVEHVSGSMLWSRHRLLFPLIALAFGCAVLLGLWRFLARGDRCGERRMVAFGLLALPLVTVIRASLATGEAAFVYPWYLIFLLPFLAGLVAEGLLKIGGAIAGRPTAVALVFAAGVAYAALASPRTRALAACSDDPRRESVESVLASGRGVLSAHVFRDALAYDPEGWKISRASVVGGDDGGGSAPIPSLTGLMRLADTEHLTLFVNVGFPEEARRKYPEIMALIEQSEMFELHSRHFGLEPQFERAVYQYTGGLFDFDFTRPRIPR